MHNIALSFGLITKPANLTRMVRLEFAKQAAQSLVANPPTQAWSATAYGPGSADTQGLSWQARKLEFCLDRLGTNKAGICTRPKVHVGDALDLKVSTPLVLLAIVVCVLGCWTGIVLFEHVSVNAMRGKGAVLPWVAGVGASIGLGGQWAPSLILACSWSGDQIRFSYSAWMVFVVAAVPMALVCPAVLLLVRTLT